MDRSLGPSAGVGVLTAVTAVAVFIGVGAVLGKSCGLIVAIVFLTQLAAAPWPWVIAAIVILAAIGAYHASPAARARWTRWLLAPLAIALIPVIATAWYGTSRATQCFGMM